MTTEQIQQALLNAPVPYLFESITEEVLYKISESYGKTLLDLQSQSLIKDFMIRGCTEESNNSVRTEILIRLPEDSVFRTWEFRIGPLEDGN